MKTITLEDLRPTVGTVHAAGVDIPVHPLRLRDIQALVRKHGALAAPFFGPAEGRGSKIVEAIMTCDAAHDVIDAAIRWQAGSAAQAPFTAVEGARIIVAAVKASIPELEKLMVEGADLLQLLGLTGDDAEA